MCGRECALAYVCAFESMCDASVLSGQYTSRNVQGRLGVSTHGL